MLKIFWCHKKLFDSLYYKIFSCCSYIHVDLQTLAKTYQYKTKITYPNREISIFLNFVLLKQLAWNMYEIFFTMWFLGGPGLVGVTQRWLLAITKRPPKKELLGAWNQAKVQKCRPSQNESLCWFFKFRQVKLFKVSHLSFLTGLSIL